MSAKRKAVAWEQYYLVREVVFALFVLATCVLSAECVILIGCRLTKTIPTATHPKSLCARICFFDFRT